MEIKVFVAIPPLFSIYQSTGTSGTRVVILIVPAVTLTVHEGMSLIVTFGIVSITCPIVIKSDWTQSKVLVEIPAHDTGLTLTATSPYHPSVHLTTP